MNRLLLAVLALAALATVAGATDNNFFNWNTYRRFDYSNTPTGDAWALTTDWQYLVADETSDVIVGGGANRPRWYDRGWWDRLWGDRTRQQPYSELWMYCNADSWGDTPTFEIVPQWRWVTWHPDYPATKYKGSWTMAGFVPVAEPNSLYYAPVWGDTLGWFMDTEWRVYGGPTNDSTKYKIGVTRRTWK